MVEEPEPFPPPKKEEDVEAEPEVDADAEAQADEDEESSLSEQTAVCLREEVGTADSAPHPASSSTASEEGSGPPTAPQSPPAPVRAGRASIPDELEPAQLARLTDLKESNA